MNIFKSHKGICIDCNQDKWIVNSKGQCEECRYKQNHGGKTKLEVQIEKEKSKPKKTYQLKRTSLKRSKNTIKRSSIKQSKESKEKRDEILKKDRETYLEVFNSTPNECEECRLNGIHTPLPDQFEDEEGNIIATWQYSHILSKGAFEEFRHNKNNFNRLCREHHDMYEFGDRESMKIYESNQIIIRKLKNGEL
jgi:hypothetical protein